MADKPSPLPAEATSLRGEIVVSTLFGGADERFEGRNLDADEGMVIRLD